MENENEKRDRVNPQKWFDDLSYLLDETVVISDRFSRFIKAAALKAIEKGHIDGAAGKKENFEFVHKVDAEFKKLNIFSDTFVGRILGIVYTCNSTAHNKGKLLKENHEGSQNK